MLVSAGRCSEVCCRAAAACLAIGLNACSGAEEVEPGTTGECAALQPGDPATLIADVRVLASNRALGPAAGSLARALLSDGEGDVYWYDPGGSVFVERRSGDVAQLWPAEPSSTSDAAGLGLAANSERLFVGYARVDRDDTDPFRAYRQPGHLRSIAKQGGQSEVLLHSSRGWMLPIAADAERVIVFAMGAAEDGDGTTEVGFYQVPLAAPRLEPLARVISLSREANALEWWAARDPFSTGQLVAGELYWRSQAYSPPRLLRAGFHDPEPEVLAPLPGGAAFAVGPGYVVTQEDAWLPGYHYAGKRLVVRDDAGCRSLPGSSGVASSDLRVDDRFAYWVGPDGASLELPGAAQRLTRVDLQSGQLSYLTLPGVAPSSYLALAGQDDTRLFLYDGSTLYAAQKP